MNTYMEMKVVLLSFIVDKKSSFSSQTFIFYVD